MGPALAPLPGNLTFLTLLLLIFLPLISPSQSPKTLDFQFGPFDDSYYDTFSVIPPATIANKVLQLTPDHAGNVSLNVLCGSILFKKDFKLWDGPSIAPTKLASFNTSFLINIFRVSNTSAPGEGLAFIIAPDLNLPAWSSGGYPGLTGIFTNGLASNRLLAIEFDISKQDYDPDANHISLDINLVWSDQTVSLADLGFHLASNGTKFFHVWIDYDGGRKLLEVYMTNEDASTPTKPKPASPIMNARLDTSTVVSQNSYFGFAASTGENVELNSVLAWNLTVEELPKGMPAKLVVGLAAGIPAAALVLAGLVILGFFWVRRRRVEASDPNIVGTLKSLPGTPREFKFKDLKKATGNFEERNKLGQGGFGVVYKGVLAEEGRQVAVKKFSRDDLKGKDDFLAELTIINRLRHRHLVPLLGEFEFL